MKISYNQNMCVFQSILEFERNYPYFDDDKLSVLIQKVHGYYDQPHRHYHGWNHIVQGAELGLELSKKFQEFELTNTQQLAWLFHDIIYVPQTGQNPLLPVMPGANESLSTQLCLSMQGDFPDVLINTNFLRTIIMDTSGHFADIEDSYPILDIDLSGFRSASIFKTNTLLLQKEFNLPDNVFEQGQAKFLNKFLERDFIYHTRYARQNWEQDARKVLTNYILSIESKYGQDILS